MATMYDAVNPANIPINPPPQIVAGYLNGPKSKWPASAWADFPSAYMVQISVSASDFVGEVLDVESGDATPDQAPAWAQEATQRLGMQPVIYCDVANWPIVQAAFTHANLPQPFYWIANWNNQPVIPSGAIASQYKNDLAPGYDVSVVDPTFRWSRPVVPVPTPVPTPTPGGPNVKYILWSAGDGTPTYLIGGNWRIALPTPEDVLAWANAGATTEKLSQAYVNSVPLIS